MRIFMVANTIKYLFFSIISFGILSCASGVRSVNVTIALREDPESLPEFVRNNNQVNNLQLGGDYELMHDMWLIGGDNQFRGRYRLSVVGTEIHIFPKKREDFERNPSRYRTIVDGVLDKGTVLRSVRVEYFRPSIHGLHFGGIIFEIQDGDHKGKYVLGVGDIMIPTHARNFDGSPNPEFLREITPPYLNAAGLPLNTSKTSTDE